MVDQPQQIAQLSAKAQEQLGFVAGTKFYSPFPFARMNTSASRPAIDDKQFSLIENFIRVGDGNLRTAWDIGPAVFTAADSKTILSMFFFNIGSDVDRIVVFYTDGTAVQYDIEINATTTISSTASTFYTVGSPIPACVQWGSQYVIISNNITPNSYWIWDGTILYSAGSIGPTVDITSGGNGYSSAPTVTAFGGSGSGITATAIVADGAVVAVNITNPGSNYLPGDTVQFHFSGGGSDTGAILTAVLATGTIGHITLLGGGSGFTAGTYALGITGGGGSGAAGTYTVDSSLSVVSINLTSGGSGYTSAPTISFPSGGGSGATAQAILNPGTVASVTVVNGGTGYNTTPTITFVGGGGSGATAVCNVAAGVITTVSVTNGGSGYTSAPAVEVQSGVNNAATAMAELMPFGVSGTSIETFLQRVWLPFPNHQGPQQNGGVFLVSAPESLTDFATSDGGLLFTSTDRFLRANFVNIRQSNGYLYPMGDSSIDVISNVNTSGSPVTTTFNFQNVDPQIGATWRDSVQDFSTTILFANTLGVFGVYGGRAVKVSKDMDDIFLHAILPPSPGALTPSSATASIFNIKHYLLLMTITDPQTGSPRNVMLGWNEQTWSILSQSTSLTYIATQEIASNLMAWGTDGTHIYQLFAQPSATLKKTLQTKSYGLATDFLFKDLLGFYMQGQDKSVGLSGINCAVSFDVSGMAVQPVNPSLPSVPSTTLSPLFVSPSFQAPPPYWPVFGTGTGGVPFLNIGATLTTTSPDFALANLILSYSDISAYQ